jgi:hypothetical protein
MKPASPLARHAGETWRKERMMTKLTTILTGLAFGAAALCLTASAIGQESGGGTAGERAAVEDAIETAGERVDAVAGEIEALGEKIDEAAAGTAAGAVAGEVDPNLEAVLRHREAMRRPPDFQGGAVAIVVPVAFFAMMVLMVFLPLYLRNRRRAVDAELQRKAVEAGMQFIPELPAAPLKHRNDKRTGLVIAGVGVALAVPLALIGQLQIAAFGLAPVILGLVYVLIGAFLPTPASSK